MTRVSTIYRLWLPLAVSFELMMLEGPAFQAAIGRLANSQLHLGAWGLAMALSLLIESPVIMLLATAIALVHDATSFRALRRFVVYLAIGCTAITGAVAFTPLYDLITVGLMKQPADIAAAARPAMQIMLVWTAAIAWRRFYQGVLVKFGHTSKVSWGTFIRLAFAVGSAVALVMWGRLPGAQVAAVAVMAAVVSEAVATTLFARPLIREHLSLAQSDSRPLRQREILAFHLPLAGTTLLTFITGPLTNAALARLDAPEETLAAWPVVFMVILVLRGVCFPVQEITVAQWRRPETRVALRQFALLSGLATTLVTAIVVLTPVLNIYLGRVISVHSNLYSYVHIGAMACVLVPLLTALGSWARGLLVACGQTKHVYRGMAIGLAAHSGLLVVGVGAHLPGMWVAASAFTVGTLAEYLFLYGHARRLSAAAEPALTIGAAEAAAAEV